MESPPLLGPLHPEAWRKRDATWRLPLWARAALVVTALALFAVRLADRDLVPFILDEAQFQEVARTHARAGTWPDISPVIASLGVPYGPGPVWFYTAVHRVVGPLPERSALADTLFLSLTQLALAAALARVFRGGWVLFATLAALLGSSPFLFFWSRLAWDVLAGYTAAAVALIAADRPLSPVRGALVGALLGLALASHPMTVPLVLAVLGVLGWDAVRRRSGIAGLLALVAAMILVNLPYLEAIRHQTRAPALPGGPGLSARLPDAPGRWIGQLLEPARVLTTTGIDYFFDGAWADFRAWLGWEQVLLATGPVLTWVLALVAAAGLVSAARSGGPGARRVARIALLAWVGHAALFAILGLVTQPHYQLATWWLVPAGLGAAAMALLPRHPRLAGGLLLCIWGVALTQASFDRAWMRWVRERGGTAGVHYSVPMAAQRAFLREACATDRAGVALANRTYLFPHSLLSLAHTEPACAGKRIGACPGSCPPLDASWRVVSLRYASPPGGRLAPIPHE